MEGNESKVSQGIIGYHEAMKVREIVENGGLGKLQEYLMQNLERWKNEEVRFAITGRSATGKSTFINTIRGVSLKDTDNWAKSGRGSTTVEPTPYKCPLNSKIIYWDLPGVGTMKFRRENYVKDVQLEIYDIFIIFMEHDFSEDDEWLATKLTEMKKPFCFVRSKVDHDIKNAEYDGIEKIKVIPNIREQLMSELSSFEGLKDNKLFIISSRDASIGDWNDLLNYIETSLPDNKFEAFVFSLPGITSSIIERKKTALGSRIKFVAIGAAGVAALPVPALDVAVNIGIIAVEVMHYRTTFGMVDVESSIAEQLKCSKYLSKGDLSPIIMSAFPKYFALMAAESAADFIIPLIGSVISSGTAFVATTKILRGILDMFVDDAYTLDKIFRENIK